MNPVQQVFAVHAVCMAILFAQTDSMLFGLALLSDLVYLGITTIFAEDER